MRVGLLGAGTIARAHAEGYARAGARVAAVAEVDRPRGRGLADELGAAWFADWRELLERGEVDAVSVCLPHSLHAPATLDAAAAGKHVLCEKPIATTLADADRMIAACRRAGVTLMVGHTHRFRLEHVVAKELLDRGEIGRVVQVRDAIWAGRADPRAPLGWRGARALNGGGVFMDNGVHAADRLRWWIGAEAAWVAAATGRAAEVVEGEDHGAALIGFAGGAVATLEQALVVPRGAGACYAQFLGSEGVLRVDTWQRLQIARGGGDWEEVPLPDDRPNGFDAEIQEFVAAARQGRAPSVTGQDGRAALELILAIYRAAETGQVVRLPLEDGPRAG
ncbi:MAG TPA: Gfo/Idh/MocA family oxidoreductase [Chloroflexota bacterium]|nr:Gfo/Idh/MocA family oxidoreductase [Chloroflexota bacterium]